MDPHVTVFTTKRNRVRDTRVHIKAISDYKERPKPVNGIGGHSDVVGELQTHTHIHTQLEEEHRVRKAWPQWETLRSEGPITGTVLRGGRNKDRRLRVTDHCVDMGYHSRQVVL